MKKIFITLALLLSATLANASTYHFVQTNPNNNTLVKTPLGDQLTLDVNAGTGNQVLFRFTNPVGIASSITNIFFGDEGSTLFSSIGITSQSAGVVFEAGSNPPVMPDAQNFTEVASAQSIAVTTGKGQNKVTVSAIDNGINASGEFVEFTGLLKSGNTFSTVLASILSRDLQFGLLMKVDNGSADKYLNAVPVPSVVPVPAALWLFGSVIGLFTVARRRY
jgi:hypothetical protein